MKTAITLFTNRKTDLSTNASFHEVFGEIVSAINLCGIRNKMAKFLSKFLKF